MISMPARPRVARLVVGPDDAVILVAPPTVVQADLELLQRQLDWRFPKGVQIIVVPHGFRPHLVEHETTTFRSALRRALRHYWERLGERWPR